MKAKLSSVLFAPAFFILVLGMPDYAPAQDNIVVSRLLGANENPIVLSDGVGQFIALPGNGEIVFRLSYEGLENVQQAHIHVANPWENGSITVFLCTNLNNTPPGATARVCPASPSVVDGTIIASDVQAVNPIPAGDLNALIKLMRDGATYVNVHTTAFPSGELRGQTNPRRR